MSNCDSLEYVANSSSQKDWHTKQTHDEAASCELAGAFVLFVKKHGQQCGEERGFDLAQLLKSDLGRTEPFEAKQGLV